MSDFFKKFLKYFQHFETHIFYTTITYLSFRFYMANIICALKRFYRAARRNDSSPRDIRANSFLSMALVSISGRKRWSTFAWCCREARETRERFPRADNDGEYSPTATLFVRFLREELFVLLIIFDSNSSFVHREPLVSCKWSLLTNLLRFHQRARDAIMILVFFPLLSAFVWISCLLLFL